MYNAEHYVDTTASIAVENVSKKELASHGRVFSSVPAFVSSNKKELIRIPADKPVSEMTLEEISPSLKACIKCYGDPVMCIDCVSQCPYGKRAVEILESETKPEAKKVRKSITALSIRSMEEYKKAIESGDVFKYALENSKSKSSDMRTRKSAAYARVSFWRKHYGALIKEDVAPKTKAVAMDNNEPHLKQMPCLSKKVAEEEQNTGKMTEVFTSKLNSLRASAKDIQAQIDALVTEKTRIESQISAIETTAGLFEISTHC